MRTSVEVSLIVPVCEHKKDIFYECFRSYCGQTFPDLEILVVDNGCDGLDLGPADDRVRRLRNETNLGAALARNLGAAAARGRLLLFVDSDIRLPPDAVTELVDEFRRVPCDALMARHTGDSYFKDFPSVFKHAYVTWFYDHQSKPLAFLDTSCLLIPRAAFDAHGGFKPLPTLEDYEIGSRAAAAGATLRMTDRVRIEHLRQYTRREFLRLDVERAAMRMRIMSAYRLRARSDTREVLKEYALGVPLGYLAALSLVTAAVTSRPSLLLPTAGFLGGLYHVNRGFSGHFYRLSGGRYHGEFELFLLLDMLAVGLGAAQGLATHLSGRPLE